MSIAFVQQAHSSLTSGVTSVTVTLGAAATVGNTLIVSWGQYNGSSSGSFTSVTDNGASGGNSYSAAVPYQYVASSNDVGGGCYYTKVTESGATDITVTFSGNVTDMVVVVSEFSGVGALDQATVTASANSGAGTSYTSGPTGTIATEPELVLAICAFTDPNLSAIDSSYTNQYIGAFTGVGSKVVNSIGTESATITLSGSNAQIITFIVTFQGVTNPVAGTASCSFSASGALSELVSGTGSCSFAATGALSELVSGTASCSFAATGLIGGKGALAGTASCSFAGAGVLVECVGGMAACSFAASGLLGGAGALAGSSSCSFAASAGLSVLVEGEASCSFAASGHVTIAPSTVVLIPLAPVVALDHLVLPTVRAVD